MKNNILKVAVLGLIATVYSCKPGDFGDLNVSPNSPSKPVTNLFLTNAERSISGIVNSVTPRLYVQQNSETLYTNASRYNDKIFDYSGTYSGALQDLQTIIDLNSNAATKGEPNVLGGGSNANQIAVARILKAFFFQNATDRWGDIPYSQALKGLAASTPKFDKQADIYTALFKELKEANAQFDAGATVKGDFLMGGSIAKWKKFANTIRMNMALRLSQANAAVGKAEFNAALADGVLASNADNIFYTYLAESANENNMYNNYEVAKRYDYSPSKTIIDKLNADADPRVAVYADKNNAGIYKGYIYGVTQAQAAAAGGIGTVGTNTEGANSRFGTKFRLQNSPVSIFTYAEVCFSKAEAYKLGWITGAPDEVNAEAQYLAGITASLAQHGVASTPAFLTNVAYVPANGLEQIITQKWVANYMGYGYEAWSDWRRTGFPVLAPSPVPLSVDGKIPVRQQYTANENALNKTNYLAVIASQGADLTSTPVWWDK